MLKSGSLAKSCSIIAVAATLGTACVSQAPPSSTTASPTSSTSAPSTAPTSSPVLSSRDAFQIGTAVHIGGPGYALATTVSSLTDLNATFRNDVHWSQIETTKGVLQFPSEMKQLDDLVTAAAANHKHPILILDYGNQFYDGGGQISSEEGLQAFAKYARFVVNHFKGRVDQFEVWNEWNTGTGASKGATVKGDPVQYANLLRITYQAIKAENPNATVLGGVIGVGASETAWVEKFAGAHGLDYLDAFSAHPYVQCWLRKTPGNFEGTMKFGSVPGTPEFSISLLDQLHGTLQKYSPTKQIPIYVSEVGWPTSNGQCGVPQNVAAAYLQRFFLLASARPWIAGTWWYDLVDDGTDGTKSEQSFGLLTQSHQPKPAYQALQSLHDMVAKGGVVATYADTGQLVVTGKTTAGKTFYAAWLQTDNFSAGQAWTQAHSLNDKGMKIKSLAQRPGAGDVKIGAVPTVMVEP